MLRRLMNVLRAIVGIFIGNAEDAVGADKLMADDRDQQAEAIQKSGLKVDRVGKFYQQTIDMLSEAKGRKDDYLAVAQDKLQEANEARKKGNDNLADQLEEEATTNVNEAAEEDEIIARLTKDMDEALAGHNQALEIWNRARRQVLALGHEDGRTLMENDLSKLKEESQMTLLSLLDGMPKSKANDIRARVKSQTKDRDQLVRSRQVRIEMLLKEENAKGRAQATRTTAKSSAMMAELKKKAGYATPEAASAETSASDLAEKIAAMKKE